MVTPPLPVMGFKVWQWRCHYMFNDLDCRGWDWNTQASVAEIGFGILKWCVLREKHCLFDLIFPDTNLCYIPWQDIWIKALHFCMFSWNNNFVVIAVILRSRSNDRIRSICTLRSKKNKGMIDTRYYNIFF